MIKKTFQGHLPLGSEGRVKMRNGRHCIQMTEILNVNIPNC